jgi:phosphatidylglycerol lysyltransferase
MRSSPVFGRTKNRPASPAVIEHTRRLVMCYGWNAMAYQILNPGIRRWFSADGAAVVGYVEAAGYRVVAGAPVCPPARLADVAAAFAADARAAGQRICYFGAQDRLIELLAGNGRASTVQLGAQPFWNPAGWPSIVAAKSSLRAQLARARNKGVVVREWPVAHAASHPQLQRCLSEWIATRGLPPMHFLVEWNLLARLLDRRVFVAERAGQVAGFLIATPIPLRNGWLIEQIIRGAAAPNGTNELLLDAAMRATAEGGAGYVTLGLSPLSRAAPAGSGPAPLAVRALLALVRVFGRRFYNFAGLEHFKSKFQPDGWEPIYAVADAARFPLRALYAIAGAFGGEAPPVFIARALLRVAAP